MKGRLGWMLRRLRVMSPGEVGWRLKQLLRTQAESAGLGRAGAAPVIRSVPGPPAWFAVQPTGVDVAPVLREAELLLTGRWRVFALNKVSLGFPPDWHRDPKTGTHAPAARFGKAINYRDEAVVGDIKYLWELNRHLELVTLAQAWRLSGEGRYREACHQFLDDWLARSPYPLGVNWISSLESAIRLVNWSVAWHLLGGFEGVLFAGDAGRALRQRWLVSIHQHCHFIRGFLSLHSSANNHLLGELMGLFVASVTWPVFEESPVWLEFAQAAFTREALLQTGDDGVNREQAVYYHHEVMDMMLICAQVGASALRPMPPAFLARLEAMADYLAALMDSEGQVPMWGDADDAHIVRWVPGPQGNVYRPLLAVAAVLFQRPDFKHAAGPLDDKVRWLLGDTGAQTWAGLAASAKPHHPWAFRSGGMYLLGSGFGQRDEVKLVLDCAPLGYLGIAAHGHADALSFTLAVGGEQVLVDPGTFAYHTQAVWRNHFRGTAAHNTVCVDGADQSEIAGAFLWLRKAVSRCRLHRTSTTVQVFEGEHDGYAALADPVIHRRRVEYDPAAACIRVVDQLLGSTEHEVALCWQFAEGLAVQAEGSQVTADGNRVRVRMRCDAALALRLHRGSEAPMAGWVSRSFDQKSPAWQARWQGRLQTPATITTVIELEAWGV